jgi:hypothetical protein
VRAREHRRALARGVVVLALVGTAVLGALAPAGADEPGLGEHGRSDGTTLPVTVTVPEVGRPDGPFTVSDAQLRWAINHEAGSGAYFGGCNFLMAGVPGDDGDTSGGKVWTAGDGFYRAAEGEVRVVQPDGEGGERPATFETRCLASDGRTVTTANNLSTGAQVVVDGGRGTVDPVDGTATIRWSGTFTSVFYGGLTYWWATDPVLTVRADGTGELTATAGGFGTSMEDMTRWERLPATEVVLADLEEVGLGSGRGFRVVPRYLGVALDDPGLAVPQVERSASVERYWGSFPASFVAFQVRTGQAAYWYTSGGQRDWAKPAAPLYVSIDAGDPVAQEPGDGATPPAGTVSAPVVTPPTPVPGGVRPALLAPPTGASTATPTDTAAAPAAFLATSAGTLGGGGGGLVPDLAAALRDPSQRLALMTTGLLLASAGTVVGFRKGWLAVPFRT